MRPCWLGVLVSRWWCVAGGVALVVRSWWPGWWLGLFFHRFFVIFHRLEHEKLRKIAESAQPKEKVEK